MHDNKNRCESPSGIKIAEPFNAPVFPTHPSTWNYTVQALRTLHTPDGILLDPFIEKSFVWGPDAPVQYREPWIGFVHIPPGIPDWFGQAQQASEKIFGRPDLRNNFELCKGLFTLSQYHKAHLEKLTSIPVNTLYHPTVFVKQTWSWDAFVGNTDKKIVQLGWWLRRLNAIYELPVTSYRKVFLRVLSDKYFADLVQKERMHHRKSGIFDEAMVESVEIIDYLPGTAYDRLLSENIMFADLYDTSANNAVVECIARCTPILINRLPALVEYLGKDYPLFYSSYDQAAQMARDLPTIKQAHQYLCDLPLRQKLTFDAFLTDFTQSEIFQANCGNLPPEKNKSLLEPGSESLNYPEDLEMIPFDDLHEYIHRQTTHISGQMPGNTPKGPLRLLCLVKNGASYLPEFMAHYKALGVEDFIFLDNGSKDSTLADLKKQSQVTVLQNLLPFRVYGLAFRQYLLERYGQGKWCLVVDIDEFFDFPFSRYIRLGQFLMYLEESGFDAVVTQMLDLYSAHDVGTGGHDENFRKSHRYYDLAHLEKTPYEIDNHVSNPGIPFFIGGTRNRVFGLDRVWVTKHALIRYQGAIELKHEHYVTGARLADITAVLCHYKFLDHFPAYVADAVSKEYHAGDSIEYKSYQKALTQSGRLNLFHAGSKELICSDQLLSDEFVHGSDPFYQFVSRCIQADPLLLNAWQCTMAELKRSTLQIVTAADGNYTVPVTVMLYSLLENLKKATPIEVTVLTNDLPVSARKQLKNLVRAYENAAIGFVPVDADHFERLGTQTAYISTTTYLRFAVPDLLPIYIEKALYLDADMIILKDISPLWDIDLEGCGVGAVPDRSEDIWVEYWSALCCRRLQVDPDIPYFNAGLLLMNLDVWRKQNIADACFRFMQKNPEQVVFDDQDALNFVLQNNWKPLDLKWNVTTVCYQDEVQKRIVGKPAASQVKDPCIVHFTNKEKPWQLNDTHARKKDFMDYWAKFSWPRVFNLRTELDPNRSGNAIICICHSADNLAKAAASWLKIDQVDEIVLVDPGLDPVVSKLLGTLEQNPKVVSVRVSDPSPEKLSHGLLLNLALKMTSRDKILKVTPDTLVYPDFFEKTVLKPKMFFYSCSWLDWFSQKEYLNSTFYAHRNDLLGVNGFHEQLTWDLACFEIFHRLFLIECKGQWLNGHLFLLMGKKQILLSDYKPLETMCLPPLEKSDQEMLRDLKNQQISKTAPWDYKNTHTSFKVCRTGVSNAWLARLNEKPDDPELFAHAEIDQQAFKGWLVKRFPHMSEFGPWFDRCDITQLSQRLFSLEAMPHTLAGLLYGNPNNSKSYLEKLVDRSQLFKKWWAVKERYWYWKWKVTTAIFKLMGRLTAFPRKIWGEPGPRDKP